MFLGSVVAFVPDEDGLPIFSFSLLSAHTKDVNADPRVSLTVKERDFQNAANGRVILIGSVAKITSEAEVVKSREKYLAKHKDAFYVDFG